ncbi:MAG: TerD family protein [Magnetococcales bacterium]|nr:TerD family protein [Magnetococcales bacterium]
MAISLVKGQKISLEKNGIPLQRVCVGLNWGAIESRGFFGGVKKTAVDLDGSCGIYDQSGQLLDVVYFGKLNSTDGAISHSGDDTVGDVNGDDGLDNEVISLHLHAISPNADKIVFILNSYRGQDFGDVPFAAIRIYEGTPGQVNSVLATYNVAQDPKFKGYVSMIMGRLYRHENQWKFAAIGEPTKDAKLEQCLKTIQQHYL